MSVLHSQTIAMHISAISQNLYLIISSSDGTESFSD